MTHNLALSASGARVLDLQTLGCDVRLMFGGDRADEAMAAVGLAWSWCISDEANHRTHPLEIEVVLDDDISVVQNSTTKIAASDLQFVMHVLSQAVTVACIDHMAGNLLMFHAGAIADHPSGRALAFVAGSGTGKTTFATTHGATRGYISDETVALREDHTLVPYPKPLSVQSGDSLKQQVHPSQFGLLRLEQAASLEALWFLERSATPVAASVTPVATLDALVMLAPQVSYLAALKSPLTRMADAVEAAGGLKHVIYHEAVDLRPHVELTLGNR